VGGRAAFYGINYDKGDQPQYALKPYAEGLKLGINFVVYAMTH
jgi:hypothetical protein